MRGELLGALTLILSLTLAGAVDLHFEQQNLRECTGHFDAAVALHNATLYAQVYSWMNQRDVEDWTYSTEDLLNRTDTPCAIVSYKTFVHSPTFFARLMSNLHMLIQFPIKVHKSVCVVDGVIVEDATITVPIIHQLTMAARYEVQDSQINSTIDARFDVPWYIDFLLHDVNKHLLHNFKQKVDAVAHSLCSHAPSLPGLRHPDQAYMRHAYHTHRNTSTVGKDRAGRVPPPRPHRP